jgi:hypothetical protein
MLLRDMVLRDGCDPITFWQYAERYLGVGTRTYSSYAGDLDIAPAYHPQLGAPSFTAPSLRVPDELGAYLTNTIPSDLHALYRLPGGGFLLPVHPNALDSEDLAVRDELSRCAPGPDFALVPSANARTGFVTAIGGAPVPPHFVKLHYPRRLSRFTRRLRRPVIGLQLWVADELARAGLPLLPEVGGGYVGASPTDAWGFLVRAAQPLRDGLDYTVPLFALYGRDYHRPADPPLLEQLIVASGEPAEAFVAERVIRPMVRMWVRAVLRTGCPLETHGQNTLFAFTPDGRETAILYRDSAIYVDASLRGPGELPPTNVIPRDVPMPADEVFSLTYDSFMGHHALDYVAALAWERFGVPPEALHEAAGATFRAEARGRRLLPDTVFYYDDVLYETGDWKLIDTGRRPVWR